MNEEIKSVEAWTPWQNKIPIKYIVAVAVVLLAIVALGVGINYNTPANRLKRLLDLGHKYLEEGRYEEAIVIFEEAINIDPKCMEAYTGEVEAYVNTGDDAGTIKMYEKALEVARSLDTGVLESVLRDYLDFLFAKGDYARMHELEDKYGSIAMGIDFENYLPKPYAEEHHLTFSQPEELGRPYLIDFVESQGSKVRIETDDGWIKSGLERFAIDDISTRPSEQEGYVDVIVSSQHTSSPVFYGSFDFMTSQFYFRTESHAIEIGDYYTGLMLPRIGLFATDDATVKDQKNFEWEGDSYSIQYTKSGDSSMSMSDLQFDGSSIFYGTINMTGTEDLIMTVPEEYDGLILRVDKSEMKWDEEEEAEERYLWDADGDYIYYRVSDLIK